jgi:hypothetical protein
MLNTTYFNTITLLKSIILVEPLWEGGKNYPEVPDKKTFEGFGRVSVIFRGRG